MTSTTASGVRTRPRGIDLLVLRIGASLVKWGHERAMRVATNHEEQARLIRTDQAIRAVELGADPRLGAR